VCVCVCDSPISQYLHTSLIPHSRAGKRLSRPLRDILNQTGAGAADATLHVDDLSPTKECIDDTVEGGRGFGVNGAGVKSGVEQFWRAEGEGWEEGRLGGGGGGGGSDHDKNDEGRLMCEQLLGQGWEARVLRRLFQLRLPPGGDLTFGDFAAVFAPAGSGTRKEPYCSHE